MDIFYLIAGLVLILVGANMLTDGSADMARRWGVSDMVVGLTVVAMGTSAPELVISVLSSVENHAELAIGNVVGSNIFNILMIVGVAALIKPIKVDRMVLTADIPMVMVSSLVLLAFGSAVWLGGPERIISRADGIVLLLLFAIFMRLTFARAHDGCGSDIGASDEAASKPPMPMWKAVVWTLVGLGALVGGGNWFVDGASGIASSLGVSDAIIGLTVVAVGTSLPELATTIIAALKGMPGQFGERCAHSPQGDPLSRHRQRNRQQHLQYLPGSWRLGRSASAPLRWRHADRPPGAHRRIAALLDCRPLLPRPYHHTLRRRPDDSPLPRLHRLPHRLPLTLP